MSGAKQQRAWVVRSPRLDCLAKILHIRRPDSPAVERSARALFQPRVAGGCLCIAARLRAVRPSDNPCRANLFEIQGVKALVDFAHNPERTAAFVEVSRQARLMLLDQAGDRSDEDI